MMPYYNYHDQDCPWCGGEIESVMDWGASLAFSSDEDYHAFCTECIWTEYKSDNRGDYFTFHGEKDDN